jgi:hypothetical protein
MLRRRLIKQVQRSIRCASETSDQLDYDRDDVPRCQPKLQSGHEEHHPARDIVDEWNASITPIPEEGPGLTHKFHALNPFMCNTWAHKMKTQTLRYAHHDAR